MKYIFTYLLILSSSTASDDGGFRTDCDIDRVRKEYPHLQFDGPVSSHDVERFVAKEFSGFSPDYYSSDLEDFMNDYRNVGCFFFYTTDAESWKYLRGVRGVAYIKSGSVVNMYVTKKN